MKRSVLFIGPLLVICWGSLSQIKAEDVPPADDVFARHNLVAWCIVPFDPKKRGPEQRAAMLVRLGIKRLAYDWRDRHIPTFDAEIDALRKHGVRLEAFWCPCGLQPEKSNHVRIILDLLKRRNVQTQLWASMNPAWNTTDEAERVQAAARAIGYLARKAGETGSRVALYNHGGWFGEPDNQIQIIERVRKNTPQIDNLGIVYNLYHGHHQLDRFAELLAKMKPYLLALNLNGTNAKGPRGFRILGQGDRDLELLRTIRKSGYQGPIGILHHRPDVDAERGLKENLAGLVKLLKQIGYDDRRLIDMGYRTELESP